MKIPTHNSQVYQTDLISEVTKYRVSPAISEEPTNYKENGLKSPSVPNRVCTPDFCNLSIEELKLADPHFTFSEDLSIINSQEGQTTV
jgi:hypothetical protein